MEKRERIIMRSGISELGEREKEEMAKNVEQTSEEKRIRGLNEKRGKGHEGLNEEKESERGRKRPRLMTIY